MSDLIERLRQHDDDIGSLNGIFNEAADRIEADKARIEELEVYEHLVLTTAELNVKTMKENSALKAEILELKAKLQLLKKEVEFMEANYINPTGEGL
jgi:hypothetical protein